VSIASVSKDMILKERGKGVMERRRRFFKKDRPF